MRFHATVAPFGISATTLLLTLYLDQWLWQGRASWELAGDLVDLGAALYGMAAVLVERGITFMLWALDKRREWREKWRAEVQAEIQAELLAAMQAEARAEEKPVITEVAQRVAQAQGITLDERPPR